MTKLWIKIRLQIEVPLSFWKNSLAFWKFPFLLFLNYLEIWNSFEFPLILRFSLNVSFLLVYPFLLSFLFSYFKMKNFPWILSWKSRSWFPLLKLFDVSWIPSTNICTNLSGYDCVSDVLRFVLSCSGLSYHQLMFSFAVKKYLLC